MCQIIHRLKGTPEIDETILNGASSSNRDGWGIMFVSDGKIEIEKSLDMTAMQKSVRDLEKFDVEFSLHLRFGTHGTKSLDNTHPFVFHNGDYALMHNGIFSVSRDSTKSDTVMFVEQLDSFPEGIFDIPEWRTYIHVLMMGSHNRIAVLDKKTGKISRYGNWTSIPKKMEEYSRYRDNLFFSTEINEWSYGKNHTYRYDYKPWSEGKEWNARLMQWVEKDKKAIGFSSPATSNVSTNIVSYTDTVDTEDEIEGIYSIGSTIYTVEEIASLKPIEIEALMVDDPSNFSRMVKDLASFAYRILG